MRKNPLTIEVLETLDAIDRRGSFAKASEELNKATSAVSYTVQKLEEQLDIALFQRQGRRSVLTAAGRLILMEGREILQTTARLVDKAKEVATGWEPRITIAIESLQSYAVFFAVLRDFLNEYPSIEIDVCECVLNGGWEALDQAQVNLIVGAPGPVPPQQGYRAIPMSRPNMVLAIAASHPQAGLATKPNALREVLPNLRRVITHDTSRIDVARSAGLDNDGKSFYVQNMDQKVEAILTGIGIGHLPLHRIQHHISSGEVIPLVLNEREDSHTHYLVWKISNKGKGLQALTQRLSSATW